MKNLITTFFFLLTHCLSIFSQQTTFSKVWSNYPLRGENGLNILELDNAYILVTANDCTDSSGYYCMTLVKLNLLGEILWSKEYNHSGTRYKQVMLHDSRIYLTGTIQEPEFQFLMMCLDIDGNILWEREFGDSLKYEISVGLTLTRDSHLIHIGGRDRNIDHVAQWQPVVTKFNLQGDSIWQYTFNDQFDASIVKEVIETTEHDYIISFTYCPDGCVLEHKAGAICFDSSGNIKWQLDLPYSWLSYGCFVSQMDSSTLAVKWHIDFNWPLHDRTPPAIFFTDMQGNIQDTFAFHSRTDKEVQYMEAIWERGLLGCGSNYTDTLRNTTGGWVFRMNEHREIVWDRTYLDTLGNGDSFGLNQIIPTSDGGYIATGTINNSTTGVRESHIWVLKLDSIGCLQPDCPPTSITKAEEPTFLKGAGIKIFPNPASAYAHIEFPEHFDLRDLRVTLVDIHGTMKLAEKATGSQHHLDLTTLPTGLYFVQIMRKNELILSKKISVQR